MVESYSLLKPDACANMGRDGEVETTVYGEIIQIKQDRMIPVFRCVVVETLVAQYCRMLSVGEKYGTRGVYEVNLQYSYNGVLLYG